MREELSIQLGEGDRSSGIAQICSHERNIHMVEIIEMMVTKAQCKLQEAEVRLKHPMHHLQERPRLAFRMKTSAAQRLISHGVSFTGTPQDRLLTRRCLRLGGLTRRAADAACAHSSPVFVAWRCAMVAVHLLPPKET